MNSIYLNSKIKLCVVGTGGWGNKVANAAQLVNRYSFIGSINSSTTEDEKNRLLNDADFIYVAVPPESQKEYVQFAAINNKHCVCETPFLQSHEDRKEIYNLISSGDYTKIFHVNYPYFLDQDFARMASNAIRTKSKLKFIKLTCSGNKYESDIDKAKRMYICQAFNLVAGICGFLNVNRFDKFIVHDDKTAEFSASDITFLASWDISEEPQLNLSARYSDSTEDKTVVYDQYDQVVPLLLLMSERIRNEMPSAMVGKDLPYIDMTKFNSYMVTHTFLLESTAEYFSDIFMQYDGNKIEISDLTKLFFNGGFEN